MIADHILSQIILAAGCGIGAAGVLGRWWLGPVAAALAWRFPDAAAWAMLLTLLAYGAVRLCAHKPSVKPSPEPVEDHRDIIDAEFEVLR